MGGEECRLSRTDVDVLVEEGVVDMVWRGENAIAAVLSALGEVPRLRSTRCYRC
jgi:hypothetical protein